MSEALLAEAAAPLYRAIADCRLCASGSLESVFDLGVMALTGVFPKPGETVPEGPLELLRCTECGLVQLAHNYDPPTLFGESYGYRSGLNLSMVRHLRDIADWAVKTVGGLKPNDVVLDIGCNDGTLLAQYQGHPIRFGIDPLCRQFIDHLDTEAVFLSDFFSADLLRPRLEGRKAKIITSIAMFYDLERPVEFARDVASVLAPDGIWVTEQAYLPATLANNAYDSICHEHLEYYRLAQIARIAEMARLKIVDAKSDSVNGGSIRVALAHVGSGYRVAPTVEKFITDERLWLDDDMWHRFGDRVAQSRDVLQARFAMLKGKGARIMGYGASTKGNVLLQYTGVGAELDGIAEVNADKVGRVTPGTNVPIVSELEARRRRPDAFLVLPWHFRDYFIENERRCGGPDLIFPLPQVDVVRAGA